MPTVESIVSIEAPLQAVYDLAKDIERFPEFMDDVEDVEIIEQSDERQVSHWEALIKEFNRTIEWTEEDFWDDEAHYCEFSQTEGDFTEYSGIWDFTEDGDATEVRLEVSYEYNVPLIGNLIKGLLKKKMQENCQSMLMAIKEKAEG